MKVIVVEHTHGEQPGVWYVDMTKIDPAKPSHVAYEKAVKAALSDLDLTGEIPYRESLSDGGGSPDMNSLHFNLPERVDAVITLFTTE